MEEFSSNITLYVHIFTFSFIFKVFGILCTMGAERLLDYTNNEDRIANGMLAAVLLIGTIMTAMIKPDYRRQAASQQ